MPPPRLAGTRTRSPRWCSTLRTVCGCSHTPRAGKARRERRRLGRRLSTMPRRAGVARRYGATPHSSSRQRCAVTACGGVAGGVGMPIEASATAPFTQGQWLLSRNGIVDRDVLPTVHLPNRLRQCNSRCLTSPRP